jgi:hypothetical protein
MIFCLLSWLLICDACKQLPLSSMFHYLVGACGIDQVDAGPGGVSMETFQSLYVQQRSANRCFSFKSLFFSVHFVI